jgi:glycine/D-amino acid oxidase-like deaminating enzyme
MSSQSKDSSTIVILGAGIIGLSTAYYLSQPPSPSKEEEGSRIQVNPANIHIFDPTPSLFSSASGKAAGFLASDWFSSRPMLALGALSLTEHRLLAEAHQGRERWGYVSGRAIGYTPDGVEMDEAKGDDWLWEGGSRSGVAPSAEGEEKEGYRPAWLNPGKTEDLSAVDGTAQV